MVKAIVRPGPCISARVQPNYIKVSLREVTVNLLGDLYPGPYEVTPSENEQQLNTTGKTMERNVLIYPVPFALATRTQIDNLF